VIGRISGILLEKSPPELLVDVQGVGYEIQAPMSTFYQLPATGAGVILHTHLVVREDAQQLFGFHTEQERMLFRALIRISGVGPKVALGILSGMAVDEFVQTVNRNDATAMTRIPGIGKKTAERLLVEMRDRLADWSVGDTDTVTVAAPIEGGRGSIAEEAEKALIALGYRPQDASRMIARALRETEQPSGSEALIRVALRSMG
jgi:Holliday junction DNA helicase RuvA